MISSDYNPHPLKAKTGGADDYTYPFIKSSYSCAGVIEGGRAMCTITAQRETPIASSKEHSLATQGFERSA